MIQRLIKETNYRLKLRTILHNASLEELKITKEEIQKEYERRNKKKK